MGHSPDRCLINIEKQKQMITAQIASIPQRVATLELTVKSLINQVDLLFVALNGYDYIPEFLEDNRKIVRILMDNSLGDAAKFYDVDQRKGYVLTCDDDLIYPQGYVGYMINGIKKHKGIVSLLGKVYDRPTYSYRGGYTRIYRALIAVKLDCEVDVGGTGVMAYHTDDFKISIDNFPRPNMADLWVAKAAAEQGVKITVLAHPKRYVSHVKYSHRIWATSTGYDKYQTKILNSFLVKESQPENLSK